MILLMTRGNAHAYETAAVRLGWDRYIGLNGGFVGMASFGASAPADQLYEHFGITAAAVEAAIRERV